MAGHRLFFALSPPSAVRVQLEGAARALSASIGGLTAPGKLHLTLAFLGNFPDGGDEIARARATAARVHGDAFALPIDHAASFGPTWFLGSSAPPRELAALHTMLSEELERDGFALERRSFHPHVTFLRRAAGALATTPIAPIAWQVEEFVLFDSCAGAYVELGRWPLIPRRSARP
jgi:2'-5' RNA ligase